MEVIRIMLQDGLRVPWKNVAVDHKADGSELTAADRGAEQLLRKRIAERYPDHAILVKSLVGSQSAMPSTCGYSIPPTGTASFAMGLPLFGQRVL